MKPAWVPSLAPWALAIHELRQNRGGGGDAFDGAHPQMQAMAAAGLEVSDEERVRLEVMAAVERAERAEQQTARNRREFGPRRRDAPRFDFRAAVASDLSASALLGTILVV